MLDNQSTGPDEAFGQYVIKTLSELDSNIKHLAKYRINDILFQAQTGELTRSQSIGTRVPIPTNQHTFHPQYKILPFSNQMRINQLYNLSSQRDSAFNLIPQASKHIWSLRKQQLPISTEPSSGQGLVNCCDSNQMMGSFEN